MPYPDRDAGPRPPRRRSAAEPDALQPAPPVQLPDAPARPPAPGARGRAFARGTLSALRHRDFRIFYWGQVLSLVGTWMQSTAQGWLVLELTDSEFLLGLVTALGSVPVLLFSLYAGVVADRRDKRSIILVAQSVSLVMALALAVLTSTGRVTIHWVLLLVFLVGIANAFEVPSRQSWFVELVGKRDLANAIALNSSAFNLTRIVGPALAGALIGTAGIAACFYANALSYLAVLTGLLRIPPRPRPAAPRDTSVGDNIREGFRFLRGHRVALTLVGLVAAASILAFPYAMLLPVFARDVLRVGPRGLGLMLSATGAGALAGGIAVAALAGRLPRGRLVLGSAAVYALLLAGFALSRSFPLSLLLLCGSGFAMIPFTATLNATLQGIVPDGLRGRVMSVYVFMFLGMTPVGSLWAGTLASRVGAPVALAVGAVGLLVVVAGVWAGVPELREVE